jgi:glycerol-3-phosphate acyltransferase PlsY
MFSPLLKWRGGKGVATTLGVLLAVSPWIALIALVVFGLGLATLKRVGEASVVTCLVLVVVGVLQGLGVVHLARWGAIGVGWVVVILALLVLARHKRNILIGLERRRRAVHRP